MKQLFILLLLLTFAAISGWSASAIAANAQSCQDAVFQCKDKNQAVLGTVNIPCTLQVPFNDLIPRCLPDFAGNFFRPVADCKAKWPAAVYACPTQPWPSGYNYSSCMRYPDI